MSEKDIHRFSTTRITTFKQCPRKHHYIYVEQIEQPDNMFTLAGKLWHKAMELDAKNEDVKPVFEEWSNLCMSGKLDCDSDLLEYVYIKYKNYYKKELAGELVIGAEETFQDSLKDEDYITGSIDRVYSIDGYNYIRDYKTTFNAPKYTQDDVKSSQQLLLYALYAEDKFNIKIDAVEIDEVRLAKLQPVPVKKDGKPTIDKKQLTLVTYEDYYDALASQGLTDSAEYKPVLEYLLDRGHPLFRRITAQLLYSNILSTNANDISEAYEHARTDAKYKVRGPLCNYCSYKELCDLDDVMPDFQSRQSIIDKIKNS